MSYCLQERIKSLDQEIYLGRIEFHAYLPMMGIWWYFFPFAQNLRISHYQLVLINARTLKGEGFP